MDKERGFGIIGIMLIMAVIACLSFIVWKVWDGAQNNSNSANNQQQNSQQQEQKDAQAQDIDPNQGYVVIKEWGVRFKPVEGFTGIEYFKPSGIDFDSFTFTTKALSESSPNCSTNSKNIVLGLLARHTAETAGFGNVVAQIGGYYYQYRGPQATCSAAGTLEGSAVLNLSQSLKTLEAAK